MEQSGCVSVCVCECVCVCVCVRMRQWPRRDGDELLGG